MRLWTIIDDSLVEAGKGKRERERERAKDSGTIIWFALIQTISGEVCSMQMPIKEHCIVLVLIDSSGVL